MNFIFCLIICLFTPFIGMANDTPIEVSADNELIWNRSNNTFVAKGNAVILQGEDTIKADVITANYKDDNGKTVIESIVATPDATLSQQGQILTAKQINATFNKGVLDAVTAKK